MSAITSFAKFSRHQQQVATGIKNAVVYTRVSSKEQYDTNLSLDFQMKAIHDYAQRNDFSIDAYFGGKYESAKTDGRKEFQRMLTHIKSRKGKISHILLYTLCRFSRTGGGAISLASELREEYGVEVFAVTQPADTSLPSGELQQSIQFIFAKYDNQLRRQRIIAGQKEKFSRGIWAAKPPIGYDIIRLNGVREIVINETGHKLKLAFEWKAAGEKNEAIVDKLKAMGLRMYKQQLSRIFHNPFYCGLVTHSLLDGQVIDGHHPALISQELFLKVNQLNELAAGYGVPHKKEQDAVPLKVFIQCSECSQPLTGYIVKKKNLWYYKCRTNGCKFNRSAKDIHSRFIDLLNRYTVKETAIPVLQATLETIYKQSTKESRDTAEVLQQQLEAVKRKIGNIEYSYYVDKDMTREIFERFLHQFTSERVEIEAQLAGQSKNISNPKNAIAAALKLSSEVATVWVSGDVTRKERLQKLIFPQGIVFDRQKEAFRTTSVNSVFALIASLSGFSEEGGNEQTAHKGGLSRFVVLPGFEPRLTEPKSVVLPLHHRTNSPFGDAKVINIFFPQKKSARKAKFLLPHKFIQHDQYRDQQHAHQYTPHRQILLPVEKKVKRDQVRDHRQGQSLRCGIHHAGTIESGEQPQVTGKAVLARP